MSDCPNLERNKANCTCTYAGCPRMGKCCECVAYHRRMNELPGCFFSKQMEKTYDRTYGAFCRDQKR